MIEEYIELILGLKQSEQTVLLIFTVLFFIRFIFTWLFSGRILFLKTKRGNRIMENSISVLSVIRNEEDNIRNNYGAILDSQKANFELVVVDDFSEDNSFAELGVLRNKYQNVRVSSLQQETRYSNKLAQNIALKAAGNDWVLIVPPSIKEISTDWIKTTSEFLRDDKNVLIQYSNILREKGFLNLLYRIERFNMQFKSFGFSLNGLPYVLFENNVAFKKEKYFEAGGYKQEIKEPFANLELIINKFIKKKFLLINLSKESGIKESETIKKSDYFDLLKKNIRIKKQLAFYKRFIFFTDEFTKLMYLPFLAIVSIYFFELWPILVLLVFLQIISNLFIIKIVQNRLNERKIFIPSLVYDLVMPYFKVFYHLYFNRQSRTNKWRSKF